MNVHSTTLLTLLALAAPQQVDAPAAARSDRFEIPAGKHQLPDLVARAAEFLGINVLWNQADLKSQPALEVEISEPMALDRSGCEDVITGLLYRSSFAAVPMNVDEGLWQIVNMQGAQRGEIQARVTYRTPEEVRARPNLHIMVLTTVPLKHVDAIVATTTLRPFFAMSGQLAPLQIGNAGNDRALLVQGFAPQVAAALRMIETVDQPPPAAAELQGSRRAERRLDDLAARIERLEFTVGLKDKRD